ncbi:metallophosphoesterase [Halomonas binhaiensis]|uniref:Metallophosphoesterase family protein n=1 Tax=Halomonas binhaiensis TaxID=2562282 RepID=A0A5C1NGX4_9GAMM|nr:metallophosphoesterase [Halomonas binhaiensis]QEM81447.1 metallophosphoesterase family protein [Halomonas binhaiensis]
MRLRILSDLHLEHFGGERELPDVDADVVVLAGDIHVGLAGLDWAAQRFPGQPVIYVPGNHEFYRHRMTPLRAEMREHAARLGIHLLDNESVDIGGVRFLGTTLWTDFALYDERPQQQREEIPAETLSAALRLMPDFAIVEQPDGEVYSPEESVRLHQQALSWLSEHLAKPFNGLRVVVSHHAPLAACIPERYQGDELSPAFASDLSHLMGSATLWLHGHVHDSVDIEVAGTRVLANPGGYPDEFDPPMFIPDMVVEVGDLR